MSMKRKIILSLGVVAIMLVTCFASIMFFKQDNPKAPSDNSNVSTSKPTTYTYTQDQLVFKSGGDVIEYEYLPNASSAITQGTTTAYEYHFTNVSTVDHALDLKAIAQPSGLTITYATYNQSKNDNISSIVGDTSFSVEKITPGQEVYAYILITPNSSLSSTFTTSVEWKQGEAIEIDVIKSDTQTEGTPILAIKGETIQKPDDPTAGLDDYYFDDWFLDENYTQPATFPMQAVETLYARFANVQLSEGEVEVNADGYTISWGGSDGDWVIPSKYNDKPIMEVIYNPTTCIESIILPYTIETITFNDSYEVYDVDLSSCVNLKSFYSGGMNTEQLDFSNCTKLTTVEIDDSGYWWSLTNLILPDSVRTLKINGCAGLTSINIPKSVTTLQTEAFKDCIALTSIVVPEGVTSIPNDAFNSCSALQSVVLPSTITSIGSNAFKGCTSLTNINLNACTQLTTIGANAFDGCIALENVTLSQSITTIGSNLFNGCTALKGIIMPNNVTQIGPNIFTGCTNLTTMLFSPSAGTWYQSTTGYSNGTEYDLPDVVTDVTLFQTGNYWYKQ